MSIALTQKSAVALAVNVGDVIVRSPFTFTAVPSNVENKLRLRVIDAESELHHTGYVDHDCAVMEFRKRCAESFAEILKDLKTKVLLQRRIEKLAS